jgi:hypothetical protein
VEAQDLASFKKKARAEGRTLVFIDESGLTQKPHCVRTRSPKGQTPLLFHCFNWKNLGAIAIPHGGHCPKGRLAEDGPIPARYCLTELRSRLYPARTIKNATESDGTIIFTVKPDLMGGSRLTAKAAEKAGKPWLHVCGTAPASITIAAVREFVATHNIQVLNVAGSRASKEPTVGACVKLTLSAAFGRL